MSLMGFFSKVPIFFLLFLLIYLFFFSLFDSFGICFGWQQGANQLATFIVSDQKATEEENRALCSLVQQALHWTLEEMEERGLPNVELVVVQ